MLKIAVFVSGRGSNLKAILNRIPNDLINVSVEAVVSNKSDCFALEVAKQNSISTYIVSNKRLDDSINYDELANQLLEKDVDLIVLAGFLKKIPDSFVDNFSNKIINIHPALLPAFGGKGMYGMNVHKSVFENSVQISGATVHYVNKVYDDGKIIAQGAVDISDVATPEEIAAKVLTVEHKLLPDVIKKFSENKIQIRNNRVFVS